MERLKRKIDEYLIEWKKDEHKLPLIIKVPEIKLLFIS